MIGLPELQMCIREEETEGEDLMDDGICNDPVGTQYVRKWESIWFWNVSH